MTSRVTPKKGHGETKMAPRLQGSGSVQKQLTPELRKLIMEMTIFYHGQAFTYYRGAENNKAVSVVGYYT